MTGSSRRNQGRRLPLVLAAALLIELTVAVGASVALSLPPLPPAPPPTPATVAVPPGTGTSPPSHALAAPPVLALEQALLPLGLTRQGALSVPRRAEDVGIWRDGPVPGEVGPAVLVGHVDLDGRPGVFARLRGLRGGDRVTVRRPDGEVVTFRVQRVERFAKAAFPTLAVYAPTSRAELRLVTCGGAFNRRTGHYGDNIVVFASRV